MRIAPWLLVVCTLVPCFAAEPAKPEDEWWKRAQPPKKHGAPAWSLGVFALTQNWTGLEDYEPSAAERAQGQTGSFDPSSTGFGISGGVDLTRGAKTRFAMDFFFDSFSNATDEPAFTPDPVVSGEPSTRYDLETRRLGIGTRATFLADRRFQPSAAFTLAYAQVRENATAHFPGSGVTQSGSSNHAGIDALLHAGLDVPVQKDVNRGMRVRFELGVEYRGYDEPLFGFGNSINVGEARTAGPLAYSARLGILYRHVPKAKPAP